jgi:hypothetical protein
MNCPWFWRVRSRESFRKRQGGAAGRMTSVLHWRCFSPAGTPGLLFVQRFMELPAARIWFAFCESGVSGSRYGLLLGRGQGTTRSLTVAALIRFAEDQPEICGT